MPKAPIRKDIHEARDAIKEVMITGLKDMAEREINQIMKNYRKLTPARKVDATKNISDSGLTEYKNALLTSMAVVVAAAIDQARREVPKAAKVKLAEWNEETLALGEFEDLPPSVRKRLKSQVNLLADTQKNDLDKSIMLQFSSSVGSTTDEKLLEFDLYEASDKYIDGPAVPAGASVVSARGVNEARSAFFFEPDVLEEIDAFEFRNDVPETPICEDLNGTIFSGNDPSWERYQPPLHFNALLENQLIKTISGDELIQNITVGTLVKTHTGNFEKVTVVMTKFEDKEYFEIELDDGKKISITEEHPVLTIRGWVQVGNLFFTDKIICINGVFGISSVLKKKIIGQRLYNFAVEKDQSYICNGIVVHNCDSYIVPILKGKLGDRETSRLQPSSADLEKWIQFHDGKCCSGRVNLINVDIDANLN